MTRYTLPCYMEGNVVIVQFHPHLNRPEPEITHSNDVRKDWGLHQFIPLKTLHDPKAKEALIHDLEDFFGRDDRQKIEDFIKLLRQTYKPNKRVVQEETARQEGLFAETYNRIPVYARMINTLAGIPVIIVDEKPTDDFKGLALTHDRILLQKDGVCDPLCVFEECFHQIDSHVSILVNKSFKEKPKYMYFSDFSRWRNAVREDLDRYPGNVTAQELYGLFKPLLPKQNHFIYAHLKYHTYDPAEALVDLAHMENMLEALLKHFGNLSCLSGVQPNDTIDDVLEKAFPAMFRQYRGTGPAPEALSPESGSFHDFVQTYIRRDIAFRQRHNRGTSWLEEGLREYMDRPQPHSSRTYALADAATYLAQQRASGLTLPQGNIQVNR